MKKLPSLAMACIGLLLPLSANAAENWPQWRGPNLNGSTTETGLPDKLDPDANALWKAVLPGHSNGTPIIWEDRVFITALDRQSQKLLAICMDNKTGKPLWQREVGEGFASNDRNNLATPSPITDGKTVWFYYGSGDLAAFDMEGKPLWSRNLVSEYGPFNINWLYGSSPLLHEGKLYVQVIHRDVSPRGGRRGGAAPGSGGPASALASADSYLLIIDPATGKNLARVIRPSDARAESKESYATPIPYKNNGKTEILLVGGDCVTGHDAETGKELWRFGGWNPQMQGAWRVVPSVVIADTKAIFCTPQSASRTIAITLGGSGDISTTHKAWENTQAKSDVPVPLLFQGNLYVLDGDFRKGISCLDPKTGTTKWNAPIASSSVLRVSPTGADGKIYVMNEQAEVWVLSAADGKILSNTTLATEGQARGSIVAAQGRLFVRTGNTLYCFGKAQ